MFFFRYETSAVLTHSKRPMCRVCQIRRRSISVLHWRQKYTHSFNYTHHLRKSSTGTESLNKKWNASLKHVLMKFARKLLNGFHGLYSLIWIHIQLLICYDWLHAQMHWNLNVLDRTVCAICMHWRSNVYKNPNSISFHFRMESIQTLCITKKYVSLRFFLLLGERSLPISK